jgi:hypothetical protein
MISPQLAVEVLLERMASATAGGNSKRFGDMGRIYESQGLLSTAIVHSACMDCAL